MTLWFHRDSARGVIRCGDPERSQPARDRVVEQMHMSETRWRVFGFVMSPCDNFFAPGERGRVFDRLGWPE